VLNVSTLRPKVYRQRFTSPPTTHTHTHTRTHARTRTRTHTHTHTHAHIDTHRHTHVLTSKLLTLSATMPPSPFCFPPSPTRSPPKVRVSCAGGNPHVRICKAQPWTQDAGGRHRCRLEPVRISAKLARNRVPNSPATSFRTRPQPRSKDRCSAGKLAQFLVQGGVLCVPAHTLVRPHCATYSCVLLLLLLPGNPNRQAKPPQVKNSRSRRSTDNPRWCVSWRANHCERTSCRPPAP
jgi:hypothetical protein